MPEEKKDVLDQLSKDFPSEEDVEKTDDLFGTEVKPEVAEEEDLPENLKNRHIRRLEAKLERERTSNIQLAAREAARSEYEKFRDTTKDLPIDERLITLYGDSENGRKAAQITQSLLEDVKKSAREDAREEFEKLNKSERQEVTKFGSLIEEKLEGLEDTYNIDLSGDSASSKQLRNSFLTFVGRLSPKDEDGNIESYADFDTAFELFQDRTNKALSRSKDLASRGTVKSGSNTSTKNPNAAAEQYLREQGIL